MLIIRLQDRKALQPLFCSINAVLFPRWERFIPNLGMFCSQVGNNSLVLVCQQDRVIDK